MATFEWRASNGGPSATNGFSPTNTGEGCLFAISNSSQTTSNPTLTVVPPFIKPASINHDPLVPPGPGDDLSPPNAVEASKMNGICIPVSASAGWSTSPPKKEGVYPSCVAYDLRLCTNSKNGAATGIPNDTLEVAASLEYTNPRHEFGESMVVKVAVAKTLVNEELGTELALVATQFQEFLPDQNKWVDITADVDYTETANAVVDAVLQDPNAGQTAGKATVTAKTVELTLGPFSAKARLNLTFQADRLYSYEAMSLRADAADIGTHRLLPLWVNLPFAPVNHEAGLSNLAVRLQAPPGTAIMPIDQYQEAYWHLKGQDDMEAATILAVSELAPSSNNDAVGCQFQWESLPPRSCGVLAWLALPNPVEDSAFDFVHIGRSLEELSKSPGSTAQAQVTVQVPSAADVPSLQVPLPGHGPMGSLYRLKVKLPEAEPRQEPNLILNLTLSDKSGSTGRRFSSTTMRQRFNQLAEVRFLKRLESIPALVKANVLRMDDIWMDVFLAFDSDAPAGSIRRVTFRVGDVYESIVGVVQAVRSNDTFTASRLPFVLQHVEALRGISPGGLTDFSKGPQTLVNSFRQWQDGARGLVKSGKVTTCTFVEFDTDGGHNGAGNYIQSLQSLCDTYDVRNGVVTGFGSWLNQDCASKVARILGTCPALLSLQVPEPGTEGLDRVFRTGFSAWVSALRQPPKLTVKVSAGSVSFPAPVANRTANAVEVLGFRRVGERHQKLPKFDAPDVSDESFTKAVITQAPAGDELILYIVSRLQSHSQLVQALDIRSSSDDTKPQSFSKAHVWSEEEISEGTHLAYDWLTMLTSQSAKKKVCQAPLMATSLSSRLEDEVSFRFNIASPSGKTSFLGRCKTVADRPPIDPAHQPEAPSCPLKFLPPNNHNNSNWDAALRPSMASRRRCGGFASEKSQWQQCGKVRPDGFHSSASDAALRSQYGAATTRSAGFGALYSAAAPLPPPAGGFGAPPAPPQISFGAPAACPPPPGAFGAPAPAAAAFMSAPVQSHSAGFRPSKRTGGLFGSSSSASSSQFSFGGGNTGRKQRRAAAPANDQPAKPKTDPSWRDVLAVPVGSDTPLAKQDYDDLLQAMSEIVHARRRLQGDPTVAFVCDVCGRQFAKGEPRYHCYDCQDFDACGPCKGNHNLPFHRVAMIGTLAVCTSSGPEDPLVGSLLQPPAPSPGANYVTSALPPKFDQTNEWCKLRVQRFLLAILHWWPVFRASCAFRDKLPPSLGDEMAQKIVQSFNNGDNLKDLIETVTVVVDSLMREDATTRQAATTSAQHNPYAARGAI